MPWFVKPGKSLPSMITHIACLDMDCFFVSVERLLNPKLLHKPLIIGAKPSHRGVVSACSYEARKCGVTSGMSSAQAYQLCPLGIFMSPRISVYKSYSRSVYRYLSYYLPIVEQASIDEFYLDLTGCDNLFGNIGNFLWQLKCNMTKDIGIPCSVGMGTNKSVAKIACKLAKQEGMVRVLPGEEDSFLNPFPVSLIPGVGPIMNKKLKDQSISYISDIQSKSMAELTRLFGKLGTSLFLKARGVGSSNCQKKRIQKCMSHDITFAADLDNIQVLKKSLLTISSGVCKRLREKGKKCSLVILKVRFSDFKTITKQRMITPTDADRDVYHAALILFRLIFQRHRKVRLLGISLGGLNDDDLLMP
ncbi:MAG: DNA polymerase IV, partial [Candidatus Margulisbacteria bacterium]|nr:DNA polymerase IV [Candidatus Margulisiibacteriota bacterium]